MRISLPLAFCSPREDRGGAPWDAPPRPQGGRQGEDTTTPPLHSPLGSAGKAAGRGCRWRALATLGRSGARRILRGGRGKGPAAAAGAALLLRRGAGAAAGELDTPLLFTWTRSAAAALGSPSAAAAPGRLRRAAGAARAGCAVSRCAGRWAHAPLGASTSSLSLSLTLTAPGSTQSAGLAPPPAHALHAPRPSRGSVLRSPAASPGLSRREWRWSRSGRRAGNQRRSIGPSLCNRRDSHLSCYKQQSFRVLGAPADMPTLNNLHSQTITLRLFK